MIVVRIVINRVVDEQMLTFMWRTMVEMKLNLLRDAVETLDAHVHKLTKVLIEQRLSTVKMSTRPN